jgi:hypothetical protein
MTLRLAIQIAYVLCISLIVSSCGPTASETTDGGAGWEIVSMPAADGSPGRNVAAGDASSRVAETTDGGAPGVPCGSASDTMSCVGANTCDALGSATCKLQAGEACAQDTDCAFGKCQTYYEDADGDGYGDAATADSRCDASPRPRTGEVLVGGDCCDIDARVHPGQTLYRTARSACRNYDYDCNGSEEPKPDCAPPPYGSPVPGCGDPCMIKGVPAGYIYAQSCR